METVLTVYRRLLCIEIQHFVGFGQIHNRNGRLALIFSFSTLRNCSEAWNCENSLLLLYKQATLTL